MNLKAFFVATLSSALDLGIAVPDDVLRHVTPEVLAAHLPRPLWARLLTACVGAPRVDAQLVVETIGVPNFCEHVPATIIWSCIHEIGQRVLGGAAAPRPIDHAALPFDSAGGRAPSGDAPASNASVAPAANGQARHAPLSTPPPPPAVEPKPAPPPPAAMGPSIPAPTESDDGRGRPQPGQRFRPSNTGIGRLASNTGGSRRPQAQASAPVAAPPAPAPEPVAERPAGRVRRGQTEADFDLETFVGGKEDWKSTLAVEDEQLVDWQGSDETVAGGEDRKR